MKRLYHSAQMYFSAKSSANIIVGLTALAFSDHKTCQTTWIRIPDLGGIWTKGQGMGMDPPGLDAIDSAQDSHE